VYNKPNGCSATGALAPGPDHQPFRRVTSIILVLSFYEFLTQKTRVELGYDVMEGTEHFVSL
jgi:hypothetical protein